MDSPSHSESLPPYIDDLPVYSASLQFYGLALLQVEFETPWSDRGSSLKPVVAELNSNQLNLYEFAAEKSTINVVKSLFKHQNFADETHQSDLSNNTHSGSDAYGDDTHQDSSKPMFSKLFRSLDKKTTKNVLRSKLPSDVSNNKLLFEPTSDALAYCEFAGKYRGKLLQSYTLSNLHVGEAPSIMSASHRDDISSLSNSFALVKYRNALRLRIEYTQLVLHFWSFHGMVHWFRNLSVGRDLTSSIDNRKLTTLKSIPRNISTANNSMLRASSREAFAFTSETQKFDYRDTISCEACSCDCTSCLSECSNCSSCFSDCGAESSGSSTVSTVCSEKSVCGDYEKNIVEVYGTKIVSFEDFYRPAEKKYISDCIPDLNSFDKWLGSKLTISNYENFSPKNDQWNINQNGKVFICQYTLNAMVRNYNKHVSVSTSDVRSCKEFYVDDQGLIALEKPLEETK
ncbi:hypothetical protein JCM33374_g4698 [Metschnikowia sp. JCM 33374]|nr:hypothetical protein JCM33374_g4698 [Metschnikowia sp. JCM 33374]